MDVLAIDAGNSGCRAAVVRPDGSIASIAQREWARPSRPDAPDVIELDLAGEWRTIESAITEAVSGSARASIVAVGVAAARSGLVVLDAERRPLAAFGPLDFRAQHLVEHRVADDPEWPSALRTATGQGPAVAAGPRLAWLVGKRPESLSGAKVVTLTGWLVDRLTGEVTADVTNASTIGMLDLTSCDWSDSELARWNLDAELLPGAVAPTTVAGRVRASVAGTTKLPSTAVVTAGGGDTQLALLALRAREPGTTALVGGSYWQVARVTGEPVLDEAGHLRTTIHAVPDRWLLEALVVAPGIVARWFRDAFTESPSRGFGELVAEARGIPPGSLGVSAILATTDGRGRRRVAPSLLCMPVDRPDLARGAGFRAVLEAAAIEAGDALSELDRVSSGDGETVVVGGGARRNDLWLQIVADATGRALLPAAGPSQSLVGAAMLATVAGGVHATLAVAADAMAAFGTVIEPDLSMGSLYDEVRARRAQILRDRDDADGSAIDPKGKRC